MGCSGFEFEKALAIPQAPAPQSPAISQKVDILDLSLKVLASFRANRAVAQSNGKMLEFNQRARDDLELHQAVLDGTFDPVVGLDAHEAHRNGLRALLTGEGAISIDVPTKEKPPAKKITEKTPLTAVINLWNAENKPKHRTFERTKNIISQFEKVNGIVPVQDITKSHVLKFKEHLIESGQTPANANVILAMFGTMMNYSVNSLHLIEFNPASNIRVTDKRKAKDKRRAFEIEELNAIFSSPVFSQGKRPASGGGEASYWLPLLALYTGARQTELGQLHPENVVEETYYNANGDQKSAWVIRIEENSARDQWVKNEGSERRIPVHSALIDLGFLELVAAAKKSGRSRIFHKITPNAQGELMGNWSKWFGRYRRRECGLVGLDTPFHSFRHSFKHFARQANIANDVHNELTGHETGDVADQYGGLSYPLHPLVLAIERYRIPGLSLPQRKSPRARNSAPQAIE